MISAVAGGGAGGSTQTPVITITTPGDSTQARTAGTLSVSVTDGVGGSSITPDSVAWTATDPHGDSAAAALDDDTAASTTYDETAADRISGTHRVSCVVTIDGQAYPAVEASWTVGRYRHGFWQVPVFWGDSSTWPTHDVQSGGAGNYDFDDCGLAGGDLTLALDPGATTAYTIGSGGVAVNGNYATVVLPLTTLYASWDDSVRFVAEAVLGDDTYGTNDINLLKVSSSDGNDRENIGARYYNAGGNIQITAQTKIGGSLDPSTDFGVPSLPGAAVLVQEGPNTWLKHYDNGSSVPASPTLRARRSREREDGDSSNALESAEVHLALGAPSGNSKTASKLYVWMDI